MKKILILFTVLCNIIGFMGTASANFWSSVLPTYTLSGKITNQNQEPLEGVSVVFDSSGLGGRIQTVTDSSGNYVLHPPANTNGILTIKIKDYRVVRDSSSVYHLAGANMVDNYTLHPDWISGKIVTQDGTPLEGAKITLEADGGLNGIQTIFADDNGNFRCQIPKDGLNYWVTVTYDGYKTIRERPYLYGGYVINYTMR